MKTLRLIALLLTFGSFSIFAIPKINVIFFASAEEWQSMEESVLNSAKTMEESACINVFAFQEQNRAFYLASLLCDANADALLIAGHTLRGNLGASLLSDIRGFSLVDLLYTPLPKNLKAIAIETCLSKKYSHRIAAIAEFQKQELQHKLNILTPDEDSCKNLPVFESLLAKTIATIEKAQSEDEENEQIETLMLSAEFASDEPEFCIVYGEKKPIACFWQNQQVADDRKQTLVPKTLLCQRMLVRYLPKTSAQKAQFLANDKKWIFRSTLNDDWDAQLFFPE